MASASSNNPPSSLKGPVAIYTGERERSKQFKDCWTQGLASIDTCRPEALLWSPNRVGVYGGQIIVKA